MISTLGLFGDKEQAKQEHKSSVSSFVQRFGSPLVQAFSGCFRGGGNSLLSSLDEKKPVSRFSTHLCPP